MSAANIFIKLDGHPEADRICVAINSYGRLHPEELLFCVTHPLIGDAVYEYQGIAIFSPRHRIIFMGFDEDEDGFNDFQSDFISDIGSLSSNFKYQNFIGRPREWKSRLSRALLIGPEEVIDLESILESNEIADSDSRLMKYIISLVTGSINELSEASLSNGINQLDEVKRKIVLFDADQTRFLYSDYNKKLISVQGLSGTGKTELLLHKLKDVFKESESDKPNKIFMTCHNIALANELRGRIPLFFNKMKISRQIAWNEEIWVAHAWGSRSNADSGLYSFLCKQYNIQFYPYAYGRDYEYIYSRLKTGLDAIPKREFKPCLDYILVDENQDFPEVFFEVCKKVARKRVYTAGDVFQNIFYEKRSKPKGVDIFLSRCYRTDPRTLMFAHALGLGLKESQRYNWFEKKEWESFGYTVSKIRGRDAITLSRVPVKRFNGDDIESSVEIINGVSTENVVAILESLKRDYTNILPGDIAIIMIDDDSYIYKYMDSLVTIIGQRLGWSVRRGYEVKKTDPDRLYLTNTNNVKGLEFPFVICITNCIANNATSRNRLYTMLTRSFLKTYLLTAETQNINMFRQIYDSINQTGKIIDIQIPSDEEKKLIKNALIEMPEHSAESLEEIIENVLTQLHITDGERASKLKRIVEGYSLSEFNSSKVRSIIEANLPIIDER